MYSFKSIIAKVNSVGSPYFRAIWNQLHFETVYLINCDKQFFCRHMINLEFIISNTKHASPNNH